jgi:hypothetical protein
MSDTYTFQGNDTTGIDSYIIDGIYANNNLGTSAIIQIGNSGGFNTRGVIKFSGLSDGSIPINATIVSATMSLWFAADSSANARTVRVFRLKRAWTEAGVTWNKYDGASSWQTAGGFGANDCEQTDIGTASVGASETLNTEKQWALTASSVQEIVAGTWTNNGFLIKVDTESNDQYNYHSSGNGTAGYCPKLVVVYTTGYLQRIVVI